MGEGASCIHGAASRTIRLIAEKPGALLLLIDWMNLVAHGQVNSVDGKLAPYPHRSWFQQQRLGQQRLTICRAGLSKIAVSPPIRIYFVAQ